MKRKILSLILVAALLASMLAFAPSAGAADATIKVETTDAVAKAGDTVTVDVIVTTPSTLQTYSLGFEYDESKMTHVGWENAAGAELPYEPVSAFSNSGLADFKSNEELSANFWGFGAAATRAQNATSGVKIGTLTFTIADDATPGEAYIRFVHVDGVSAGINSNVAKNTAAEDFEFVAGAVTILPDDYKTSVEFTVLDDFDVDSDITDNEDGTCTLEGYSGSVEGGAVIIPETIEGLTVTEIGIAAFKGASFTAIKIPATVTSIAKNAFQALEDGTEFYFLGDECSFVKTSLPGAYVIHGNAGSDAEAYVDKYAATYDLTFVELAPANTLSYTVDGVTATYEVSASTVAPGAMVAGDKTVIAWTDGTNTYAPGASIAVDGALALEAITVTTPKTANGASIKKAATADDLAIRFTADIAQADYAALVEAFGAANVKLGMLVTPQKYVNNAGAFTKEALTAYAGVNAYVDIAVTGYYEKNDVAGTYTLAGSLTGFSAKTIAKNPDFVAVAYISVDVDGDGDVDATVYGQYDYHTARNVLDVATLANNASTDATEKGLLATIIGWFTNGSKN